MSEAPKRTLPRQPQRQPKIKRLYSAEGRTLGAPRQHTKLGKYETDGGMTIECDCEILADPTVALEALVDRLDTNRGCLFESSYDFPGRYARWTMGFSDPPLSLEAVGRDFKVVALNSRGRVLLPPIAATLSTNPSVASLVEEDADGTALLRGVVRPAEGTFAEEERSRQHSIFSVVRAIQALFHFDDEPQLGLYGAFGYDLTFQFEPVKLHQQRDPSQRDLCLFIPDEILVIDVLSNAAWMLRYEFETPVGTTIGLPRLGSSCPYVPCAEAAIPRRRDHQEGAFAKKVERAKEEFKVGNLFETVLSQTFYEPCPQPPSTIFRRLRKRNPSPYGFLINLGSAEYLVGASPEMVCSHCHLLSMP